MPTSIFSSEFEAHNLREKKTKEKMHVTQVSIKQFVQIYNVIHVGKTP